MIYDVDGGMTLQEAVENYCSLRAEKFGAPLDGHLEYEIYMAELSVEEGLQGKNIAATKINLWVSKYNPPYNGNRAYKFGKNEVPSIKEELGKILRYANPPAIVHDKPRKGAPKRLIITRDGKGKKRVFI
jgi:hypothetical protein